MDTDPIESLLSETSNRLERARVIKSDLKAGFSQVTISKSSSQQRDLFKTFSSPLPGVHEFACKHCARYKLRLAELQAEVTEFEKEPTKAEQETKGSESQSKK